MTTRAFLPGLLNTVFAALFSLNLTSVAHAQSTGTVAGCITDASGQRLSGVTVDVRGNGRHHIGQSNVRGTVAAFAIEDGRIHSAPIVGFVGMEAETLIDQLPKEPPAA
jgi:hypothetical protein